MTTVENVIINAPSKNKTDENIYIFNLSKPNGDSLLFNSKELYNINCQQEVQMLTIPTKTDLKELSTLFNEIKEAFLKKHEEWFEEKFTSSVLDNLFKSFLYPNIVENCIDLKVLIPSSTLDEIKNILKNDNNESVTCNVNPTFLLDSIILEVKTNKMYCNVVLSNYSIYDKPQQVDKEEITIENEIVGENEIVEENEPDEEKSNIRETKKEEEISDSLGDPIEDNVEDPIEDNLPNNDELVELQFDTTNLDESKIKMNAEDYLIIYKYILGQIKENKIKSIEKICQGKGIDMEVLDCEEIFKESDDEYFSSDSENESDSESENSIG